MRRAGKAKAPSNSPKKQEPKCKANGHSNDLIDEGVVIKRIG